MGKVLRNSILKNQQWNCKMTYMSRDEIIDHLSLNFVSYIYTICLRHDIAEKTANVGVEHQSINQSSL